MWMTVLLVVAVLVGIVGVVMVMSRRAPVGQPEAIDAEREPPPPGPGTTERMFDPPPGSQADREDHGKL